MKEYIAEQLDIAIIGAGHAGIEAGLAAARLGCRVAVFTINLDAVGNMPCNPAIGGTGKGHLVRELDALGGEMGKAADATCMQSRMLNLSKGPAVHSLRMQADRSNYRNYMKQVLEKEPNLALKQAEIIRIDTVEENGQHRVSAVVTRLGAVYPVRAAIIASGTYLEGQIHIGEVSYQGGPDGMMAAFGLSDNLRALGIRLLRFKTGTPARVDAKSIDFTRLLPQQGDIPPQPFSFMTDRLEVDQLPCYSTWTNGHTHQIIRDNIGRSPLYGGRIEGIGPRYCPSIEDKVIRFSDKERHQLFVEPVSRGSDEMYLQGMSSSLPEEVQIAFLRTIPGFEHLQMMRTAYAIEYDCCDPTQLAGTLEFKDIDGLYGAGQFNGTSGYEEAAVQGFVAGVNAARKIQGESALILTRSGSYIGTLIDDIITKGVLDPYRIMTSRAEYRLLLRQDNADLRLTPIGREIGMVDDARWARYLTRKAAIEQELKRVTKTVIAPSDTVNDLLVPRGTSPISTGTRLIDLLKRPQLDYEILTPCDTTRPEGLDPSVAHEIEITLKYAGYIRRQTSEISELKRIEDKLIPDGMDFRAIPGIRLEAREKLTRIRPRSIGQASRISGITPADLSVLAVWIAKH